MSSLERKHQALTENYEAALKAPDTSPAEVEARERVLRATTLEEVESIVVETYQTICGTRKLDTFQNDVVPMVLRLHKYHPRSAGVLLLNFIEKVGDIRLSSKTLEDGQLDNAQQEADFTTQFDDMLFEILDPSETEARMARGQRLDVLGSVDGRYARYTEKLRKYFSARALTRYRVVMEVEYLITLMKTLAQSDDTMAKESKARELTEEEITFMRGLPDTISAEIVQAIETTGYDGIPRTNHDVVAVTAAIAQAVKKRPTLRGLARFVHFGLTSEDTTSCAYSLMLKGALETIIVPNFRGLIRTLDEMANKYASDPTEEFTHNQMATPKTFGMTPRVLTEALKEEQEALCALPIKAKLTGAVGNFAGLKHTFKTIDWIQFSEKFVTSLNTVENNGEEIQFVIKPNLYTTQIEPHYNLVKILQSLQLQAGILEGACVNMWLYIGHETIMQKVISTDREQETGSSTMPNKLNPIDFETAEGRFAIMQGMCDFFIRRLTKSRMGRDLSDSTILRDLGEVFGNLAIGLAKFAEGLSKIEPNIEGSRKNLLNHPEVLGERIQLFLRALDIEDGYDKLKKLMRGRKITQEMLIEFIESLNLTREQKQKLLELRPDQYIGESERIARREV